jgi:hypothetical protein
MGVMVRNKAKVLATKAVITASKRLLCHRLATDYLEQKEEKASRMCMPKASCVWKGQAVIVMGRRGV